MLQEIIYRIGSWVVEYGALGVFGASIVEEVVSIIPSSLVQLGAGFFLLGGVPLGWASLGKLFLTVSIPAALGVFVGSLPLYTIGYWGGELAIGKYGRWIGLRSDDLIAWKQKLDASSWDDVVFFIGRAFPLLPSIVLAVFGGLVRMNLFRYSILTVFGVSVRASILGFIGWQLGAAYASYSSYFDHLEYVGLVIFAGVIAWFWYKKRRSKNV